MHLEHRVTCICITLYTFRCAQPSSHDSSMLPSRTKTTTTPMPMHPFSPGLLPILCLGCGICERVGAPTVAVETALGLAAAPALPAASPRVPVAVDTMETSGSNARARFVPNLHPVPGNCSPVPKSDPLYIGQRQEEATSCYFSETLLLEVQGMIAKP